MRRKLGRIVVYSSCVILLIALMIRLISNNKRLLSSTFTDPFRRKSHNNLNIFTPYKTATRTDQIQATDNVLGSKVAEINLNLTALQENVYNHIRRISKRITKTDLSYYNLNRTRTYHCDFEFLINGSNICEGSKPFLVILIPSAPVRVEQRIVIRETWGKYASDLQIPPPHNSSAVTLAFLLGKDISATDNHDIFSESERFQDVVFGNFQDTYKNLTRKMLMGLKWVSTFCSEAEYILKADDDVFVHIPKLVGMLKSTPAGKSGNIYGRPFMHSPVKRTGRWAVSYNDYPMSFFPPYISGNSYIISGNIARKLFMVSSYMLYLHLEDVFITGILRVIIAATLTPRRGFTWVGDKAMEPCKFMKVDYISGTVKNISLMEKMWFTQQEFPRSCFITYKP